MQADAVDLAVLRQRMVDEQLAGRGLRDQRVLQAMREVARHLFVPQSLRHEAYADRPLPIGEGQTISQPYMVAAMTAALAPDPSGRVLEVGTGSGYQAAVLSRLTRQVITIERHARLAEQARAALAEAGITNVRVVVGDGSQGLPEEAPFNGIIVTAGAPEVPQVLREQLEDEGRLVIPVGPSHYQTLTIVTRKENQFEITHGEGCVFVPLLGRYGWQ